MKTQYKHIHFVNVSSVYPKRKTQTWDCRNNSGIFLGIIEWNCGLVLTLLQIYPK